MSISAFQQPLFPQTSRDHADISLLSQCPNPPNNHITIRPCHSERRWPAPQASKHPRRPHLVCADCREWQYKNRALLFVPSHPARTIWRLNIARLKVYVCRTCDREQRVDAPDEGFDGCTCYRDYVSSQWLCHRCDVTNVCELLDFSRRMTNFPRGLRIIGNRMTRRVTPYTPQGETPLCVCGRGEKVLARTTFHPPVEFTNALDEPFPGHHRLLVRGEWDARRNRRFPPKALAHTKQCLVCLQYVVPSKRRSRRIRNRVSEEDVFEEHVELGQDGRPQRVEARVVRPRRSR